MREIGGYRPCEYCDGTGEITQTNEEWLHTLNTEQKAEWLTNVINTNPCGYLLFCDECSLNDKCKEDDYPTNAETWVEWLKQPHREEQKNENSQTNDVKGVMCYGS